MVDYIEGDFGVEIQEKEPNQSIYTPFIYQQNALPFLTMMVERFGLAKDTRLTQLPEFIWDEVRKNTQADYLYLLGTHAESNYAKNIAHRYRSEHLQNMHGLTAEDLRGSIFAVPSHDDFHPSIAKSKEEFYRFKLNLKRRGMNIMRDEITNHSSVDTSHTELLFRISLEQYYQLDPQARHNFLLQKNGALALGKEFSEGEWIDTAQHAFHKKHVLELLKKGIVDRMYLSGGYRVDMAHLVTLEGFKRAWGWTGVEIEDEEALRNFWSEVSNELHRRDPSFLLIGEVYEDYYVNLLSSSFDGVYDKGYYDFLRSVVNNEIRIEYLKPLLESRFYDSSRHKKVRFLQNHDEPPVQEIFKDVSLALTALQIFEPSGMLLIQDAQHFGFTHKLPVQVKRYPRERINLTTYELISSLLQLRKNDPVFHYGEASLLQSSEDGVVGYYYQNGSDGIAICINVNNSSKNGEIRLPYSELRSVYTLAENASIDNFDNSLGEYKTFLLKPYEVQIMRYKGIK